MAGIACDTAANLNLGIESTAKLLFAQAAVTFDAGLVAFTVKRSFGSGRPAAVIPCLFNGQLINIWGGKYQGTVLLDGNKFQTYLSTPPFPEYFSAHSAYSAGSASIMTAFFQDTTFRGNSVTVLAGKSRTEPNVTNPLDPNYALGHLPNTGPGTPGYVPAADLTLTWSTWDAAAQNAGISRLYGAFHIQSSNEDGLGAGRAVATVVWDKILCLLGVQTWKAPNY